MGLHLLSEIFHELAGSVFWFAFSVTPFDGEYLEDLVASISFSFLLAHLATSSNPFAYHS